jgi:hypothetical protein
MPLLSCDGPLECPAPHTREGSMSFLPSLCLGELYCIPFSYLPFCLFFVIFIKFLHILRFCASEYSKSFKNQYQIMTGSRTENTKIPNHCRVCHNAYCIYISKLHSRIRRKNYRRNFKITRYQGGKRNLRRS